jgi:Protein of unknown function (DUF3617)
MGKSKFVFLPLALALASCGAPPDDVTNVPLSGKWSDEGKLMATTLGGTAVDMSKIPGIEALKSKINQTKEFCGEPRYRSREEFQAEMDKNNPQGCEIVSVDNSGDNVDAKGLCRAIDLPGVEGEASFNGHAKVKPDKIIYDMIIDVVVRSKQTGAGEKVSIEAQRTMKRIGDC